MKRLILFAAAIVLLLRSQEVSSQQTEFPIGVYTFRGDSLEFGQMRDSLNLTWIQGYGGVGSGSGPFAHYPIETNNASLKVITIRSNLQQISKSQHVKYEAERTWPISDALNTYNFFGTKETGIRPQPPADTAWLCQKGMDFPGYMVRQPRPDNDYHYSRSKYYATYRMKVTKGSNPADTVAVLSEFCYKHNNVLSQKVLYDSSFLASGVYYVFVDSFSLQVQPNAPPDTTHWLKGRYVATTNTIICDSVDIRVYWPSKVTTWLDYVTVDDSVAKKLFAGSYDATIQNDVNDFVSGYSLMQRFYLADEPFIPAFLPFNYIDAKLRALGFTTSRGRAFTANYWEGNWIQRFAQDAQPNEVLVDYYKILSNVPYPTSNTASSDGIVPYLSNSQYNDSLQKSWDDLESGLSSAAATSKPLWYTPQLTGGYIIGAGGFRRPDGSLSLRPPTGVEVQAQINIALAFGAKGIIPYPFGTDFIPPPTYTGDVLGAYVQGLVSKDPTDGKFKNHWSNTALLPVGASGSKTVYVGYQEKWDSLNAINKRLKVLAPTLLSLTWREAKSWKTGTLYPTWNNVVTSVKTKNTNGSTDSNAAVLTGRLDNGGVTYLEAVNLRCDPKNNNMDTRDIVMTLSTSNANWLITEMLTGNAWVVKGGLAFTDRFNPGEGKLYRLEPATVTGTKIFPQLKFVGGILTLAASANVTARGIMDTVNAVLGTNSVFKADTGMYRPQLIKHILRKDFVAQS